MTNSKYHRRYRLLYIDIMKFIKNSKLDNIVFIDKIKLRHVINAYFDDTEKIRKCFSTGYTNESKQCTLTIKALNLYKPLYLKNMKDLANDSRLSYINEIIALYCGFIYFENKDFKKKFMMNKDWIYLLHRNSMDYEQLMITLNIFYKEYNTNGN